jgi:hypothetical protein
MAILTVGSVPHPAGLDLSDDQYAAATLAGDSFPNSGSTYLFAKNSSGGALDIVADSPRPDNFGFSGNALDVTMSVPAGKTRVFGPFPENRHNDNNNRVQLTYPGGVTGLTVKVVAM